MHETAPKARSGGRVDRGGASHPLVELTMARLRGLLREPEAVFWVFVFPVLMTCALGVAFRSRPPADIRIGVAAGAGADPLSTVLRGAGGLDPRVLEAAEEERSLRNGDVQLIVAPGTPPTYRFDPSRPESRLARLAVDDALKRASGRPDPWQAKDEPIAARGSRYIDWVVPGLLGMNIMGTGLWGIAFGVVLARSQNLLKRMIATPMSRAQYLLSHVCSRLVFLALEVIVIVGAAWAAFDVPVRGSIVALASLCLLGALAFGAIGLLVSSRARTVEAVSGLVNLVMLPMWLLSGVFFSSSNFPDVMQPAIRALPLTALNDSLRAVMIDGVGLASVGSEAAVLAAWGVAAFGVTLKIFRWR